MSSSMIYSVAEEMNPSKRCTMEDTHMVLSPQEWNCQGMAFLGVYDGHGGRDICDFLQAAFDTIVKQEVMVEDNSTMHQKLERAFLIADILSKRAGLETSGATVAMCLVAPQENPQHTVIHAANVGDARIVLSQNKKAIRLTHDHLAHDPYEVARIEAAGGFVVRNRVLGILAVARSLGDHGLKRYVIAKPYVTSTVVEQRDDKEEDFVILACDGLWDVIRDQEAVDLVRKWLKGGCSKTDIAQKLCDEAIRCGTLDNVTVVVSWL